MKTSRMIKALFLCIMVGGLAVTGADAQDMDITMDVIKQSDAQNITHGVMQRIDLPENAREAGTHGRKAQDRDRLHQQDQTHAANKTDHATEASRHNDERHGVESGQQQGHANEAVEGNHRMRDDAHDARDDSHEMHDDVNDARDDGHEMRDDVNDTRDDGHEMRDDVNDVRDDTQEVHDDVNDVRDDTQEVHDDVNDVRDDGQEMHDEHRSN